MKHLTQHVLYGIICLKVEKSFVMLPSGDRRVLQNVTGATMRNTIKMPNTARGHYGRRKPYGKGVSAFSAKDEKEFAEWKKKQDERVRLVEAFRPSVSRLGMSRREIIRCSPAWQAF